MTTESVAVKTRPRARARPLTLREQRDLTVKRVLEEHQRSGTVPSTLRNLLVDEDYRLRWTEGRPMPRDAVERHIDQWAADLLSRHDQRKEDLR